MPAISEGLWTAEDLMAYLKVSMWYVRHKGHTLPGYIKIGRMTRWNGEALKASLGITNGTHQDA